MNGVWTLRCLLDVECRPAFHTYETYELKTITTTNTFKLESAIEIWFCEAYPEGFLMVNLLIIVTRVFLAMAAAIVI